MDGNKLYRDPRFRIDAENARGDWGPGHPIVFSLCRRYIEITRVFGRSRVRWERMGSFATFDDARLHYYLIKDLPEYLP